VCVALGVDPPAAFRAWVSTLGPELLKGPFNHQERQLVSMAFKLYYAAGWGLCVQVSFGRLFYLLHGD
jgi:hypothetical protein